ncbi:DUF438 domain-containing protein [Pseudobdellovibrio sp. HCB154]|uniref:DUF438 domain-containing protein n=1 Tax=Pseudobdellovibrio sp. HCB154 TaxID=3386277 RepID=UPI00391727D6
MNIESLIPEYAKKLEAGHPLLTYVEENRYLIDLLNQLSKVDIVNDIQLAYNLFNQIACVDIRYTRKENQLFPYLEKRGWFGPSQGMWRFHDDNRQLIKDVRAMLEKKETTHLQERVDIMLSELLRMMNVEESRLFPIALDILLPEDWEQMKAGEGEIGWMHKTNVSETDSAQLKQNPQSSLADSFLKLSEGKMTLEQINLLFQVMPFDLTFVDENDKVAFYNRGEERVFPRSSGVIGREVRFCHPPKSVDAVLRILEEFKAGRKDVADFWINYRGRLIHIRYFAVRDKNKVYRGVIEVSQDVTEIKKLEGEKRLLNWE